MVTPASRGGEPPRFRASEAPSTGTLAKAQEAFDSTPKTPRPNTAKPQSFDHSAISLTTAAKGSLLARVVDLVLRFFGLRKAAKQVDVFQAEKRKSEIVEELPLSPFEEARGGGPATKVFESVQDNPDQTVDVAESRYKSLKDLFKQQNHATIDTFAKNVDCKLPPKATYSEKLAALEKYLKKTKANTAEVIRTKKIQVPALEERIESSGVKHSNIKQMIQEREGTIKRNGEQIDQWNKETKTLMLFGAAIKENPIRDQEKKLVETQQKIQQVSTWIAKSLEQNVFIEEQNSKDKALLLELEGQITSDRAIIESSQTESSDANAKLIELGKSTTEFGAIKKAVENRLPQLLNSYVLREAVKAYKENPFESPRVFLHAYKSENESSLKAGFTAELEDIGLVAPGELWSLLPSTETRSSQAAQESIANQLPLISKDEIPPLPHTGSTTFSSKLAKTKKTVSNLFRWPKSVSEEVVERPLSDEQKAEVRSATTPLPLLTEMQQNPDQSAAIAQEARTVSEEMEGQLRLQADLSTSLATQLKLQMGLIGIQRSELESLRAELKEIPSENMSRKQAEINKTESELRKEEQKANDLNSQLKTAKMKAATQNREPIKAAFRAFLKQKATHVYQNRMKSEDPKAFRQSFLNSRSTALIEEFSDGLDNLGIASSLVDTDLTNILAE